MIRIGFWTFILHAFAGAQTAAAANAAKEVRKYHSIEVSVEQSAKKCGVNESNLGRYKEHIKGHLKKLGIPQSDAALVKFTANVYAEPFGALKERCFVRVALNMVAQIDIEEVTFKTQKGSDKKRRLVEIMQVKSFPVVAYRLETMYPNAKAGVAHSVLGALDRLFAGLKLDRDG